MVRTDAGEWGRGRLRRRSHGMQTGSVLSPIFEEHWPVCRPTNHSIAAWLGQGINCLGPKISIFILTQASGSDDMWYSCE